MIAIKPYLLDAPLCPYGLMAARDQRLLAMTGELLKQNAYAERGDAIKVLRDAGYDFREVFCLVDDAVFRAKQERVAEAVAEEMGDV